MSPHRLLQEQVSRDRHYPWRVIVSCALLNRTTGQQAHKAAGELFQLWPDPLHWGFDFFREGVGPDGRAWLRASAHHLSAILQPLGLVNRRTELLHDMTCDYLARISPYDCRGVGRYGRDALDIFCQGRVFFARPPADTYLNQYITWRIKNGPATAIEWDEAGYIEWLALTAARRGVGVLAPPRDAAG